MDFQECLHLFLWILTLHIPQAYGFPIAISPDSTNLLKVSLNKPATSKSQVPYLSHEDVINSRTLPKVYQLLTHQNGAKLENVEKYFQHAVQTDNSAGQILHFRNKQGIDSYLRYLPRNSDKYSSHSRKKGIQKVGIGTTLDIYSGKHITHESDSKTATTTADVGKDIQTSLKEINSGQGNLHTKELKYRNGEADLNGRLNSNDNIHKRNVIVNQPKDRINFAVMPAESVVSDHLVINMILAIGAGIVALGMGIVIGIFGCCCKKKKVTSEKDREEQSAIINTAEEMDKGLPDARLDLSDTSKSDEQEPMSIKDKIKAFENDKSKVIIPPPADVTPQGKIRNTQAFSALEGKPLFIGMTRPPPPVVVREDADNANSKTETLVDTAESKTEELSKSDTHEEVSDIPLDNTSTHSSISQPHNPDVVIASDDEDEFADLQRGTVILKSFQRAKPPRNRSPATRSNRKLRPKSPAHLRSDRESPIPSLMSTSLYVDSTSEKLEDTKDKSGSVPGNLDRLEPVNISKSIGNNEIQRQSKSNGGSSSEMNKSKDVPNGATRYIKNKDSPLTKPKYRKKDREPSENESANRISLSELEDKQKRISSAIDSDKGKTKENVKEVKVTEAAETSVKRLSGLPANVNNIFYLIDPTVKDKCRSVGDVTDSSNQNKRKSKDVSRKDKASKHKTSRDNGNKVDDDISPKKRERTFSDPARQSREMDNTSL